MPRKDLEARMVYEKERSKRPDRLAASRLRSTLYRKANPERVKASAKKFRIAHKEERAKYWRDRVRTIKRQLVDEKGGACELCGYNKSLFALDFDHIDPTMKTQEVSRLLSEWKFDAAIEEAKKCRLLCANCHREQTYGIF